MKTVEEINELAEKRYGTNPHSFGGQRDGFKEGFKQAQELQLLQSRVSVSVSSQKITDKEHLNLMKQLYPKNHK